MLTACLPAAARAADVLRLIEVAVVLGWLVRVDTPQRAAWLSQPRCCAALLALALAVSPALSALSAVPGLQVSLSAGSVSSAGGAPSAGEWGVAAQAAAATAGAAATAAVVWHMRHARATLPRGDYVAFAASRFALLALYSLSLGIAQAALSAGAELREVHLHHLYLGLLAATFGRFNHGASGALLAIGAGIFAHGVGAYGFAPLLGTAGCVDAAASEDMAAMLAARAGCRWNAGLIAGGTLRMRVCPGDTRALAASIYAQCAAPAG